MKHRWDYIMENLERRSCFFVGDTELPAYRINAIRQQMKEVLEQFTRRGILDFLISGESGFEMLAAEEVIRFRMRVPELKIKLIYLPPTQEEYAKRSTQDQQKLDAIRWTADQVVDYATYPALRNPVTRKQVMADRSAACVTYFAHTRDCSSDIIQYAQQRNVYVSYLAKSPSKD